MAKKSLVKFSKEWNESKLKARAELDARLAEGSDASEESEEETEE